MKLEGSLDAFSLPDVFQLLSLTKKSGGLHLSNGLADTPVAGAVYFSGGAITGAISDASRQSLARRIVGLGACDDAALRRAVERAATENVGVARALAEGGAVDAAVLTQLALEQVVDAVFDLLRWLEGDFSFSVDEENSDDVGLAVPAEQIVAEANSRRETWDAVSRVIPSPEVVLEMPVIVPEGPTITREEWSLLALIDGHRTVGELVEVCGSGQFAVVSSLASLVQRGMLNIHDEDSPDHVTSVRRRQLLLAPLETGQVTATDPVTAPVPATGPATGPTTVPTTAEEATAASIAGAGAELTVPLQPAIAHRPPPAAVAPAAAEAPSGAVIGGAHQPINVVPPRPEPFLPKRDVDHPEPARGGFAAAASSPATHPTPATAPPMSSGMSGGGAAAATQPVGESAIERDPTVNRSLMLRLIAGVRGL